MFLPNNETGLGSNGSRTDGRNLVNVSCDAFQLLNIAKRRKIN